MHAGAFVHKTSLSLTGEGILSFSFDAALPGTVSVYVGASEHIGPDPAAPHADAHGSVDIEKRPVFTQIPLQNIRRDPATDDGVPTGFAPGLDLVYEMSQGEAIALQDYLHQAGNTHSHNSGDQAEDQAEDEAEEEVDDQAREDAGDAGEEEADGEEAVGHQSGTLLGQIHTDGGSGDQVFPLVVVIETEGGVVDPDDLVREEEPSADASPAAAGTGGLEDSMAHPSTSQEEQVSLAPIPPQIQVLYAVLELSSSGRYSIRVLRQKLVSGSDVYLLQDVYGLDADEDGMTECVVCMSDPRDTLVLPCRHMCLCAECGEELRVRSSKCPICRTHFTSLLCIRPPTDDASKDRSSQDEHDEEHDEDREGDDLPEDDLVVNTNHPSSTTQQDSRQQDDDLLLSSSSSTSDEGIALVPSLL